MIQETKYTTAEVKRDLLWKMQEVLGTTWQVATIEESEETDAGFQPRWVEANGHIVDCGPFFKSEDEALNWALGQLPEWWD